MRVSISPASALLAAVLVAGLLAVAATTMLIETRAARGASSEAYRFARAQAAAASALAIAEVRLDAGDPLPAQGILFETASTRVRRQDATGLIDINAAPPERLAALFASLGTGADEATSLGDAIADWRDGDDLRRLHGAEAQEYLHAGLSPPGNRSFVVETELSEVIGMRGDLLACALPYLTVYSGADIDASRAPPDLRQRLGLDGSDVFGSAALGNVVLLRADAPISPSAAFTRTIWLRLTGDPAHPFMIHRAVEGFAPSAPAVPTCAGAST